MIIDKSFLDELSAQTKANPRLRQNYDLRTTPSDGSQRMLNRWSSESRRQIYLHYAES